MITLANFILAFAFVLAGYASSAGIISGARNHNKLLDSTKRSVLVLFILVSILVLILEMAFINRDFSLSYVAAYSSRSLPLFYTLSALWAGQSGSLLFWSWLLSLFAAVTVWQNRRQNHDLIGYAIGIISLVSFFFLGIMIFATNPFELLPNAVADGRGLNPMLQNPGMVLHPPALFLGYVGFTIPFAFAMAALLKNRVDAQWIRTTRRWTLFAWLLLTIGNVLGAKWAYVELGWGGYWAWDPVENASFMPWLTATAFLHSVMIQEKRGMLKIWNISLIILTFSLTLLGTFITRSGIISSVHSFGVSNLGPLFLAFLGLVIIASVIILVTRLPLLKSEHRLDGLLSRESSFLFNNLILISMTFAVLWGTLFPIISEAVRGVKITVGTPFFNQVNIPIGLTLLALTGICPLIAWRKTSRHNLMRNFIYPLSIGVLTAIVLVYSGMTSLYAVLSFSLSAFVLTTIAIEFYRGAKSRARKSGRNLVRAGWDLTMRNKRRYGGYIVHLGVVMVFVGMTGGAFRQEKEAILLPGDKLTIGGYELIYQDLTYQATKRAQVVSAEFSVTKNGQSLGTMRPSKDYYVNNEPISEVAIRQTPKEDLYLVLASWNDNQQVGIKVIINPLVFWIWNGGLVMLFGTLLVMGPKRRSKFVSSENIRVPIQESSEVHHEMV